MNNYKLIDLQLHKEEIEKFNLYKVESYYLSATYQYENDRGVYEVYIPRILLNVRHDPIMTSQISRCYRADDISTIDLGFGELPLLKDDKGVMYYEKLIEEKVHDMTLGEIEKKLGYKVRVVSEKEV